jgi:CotH kinase protein/Lamin Tail Domain/Chitobiase/beta-hexosaminidase C-terminal domain
MQLMMSRLLLSRLFLILSCFLGGTLPAQLALNEYCASNKNYLSDAFGDYPDWIEIYNTSSNAVNLGGFYLSDSPGNLQKWAFPAQMLPAGQTLLVFASNRNTNAGGYDHTNFKLTQMRGEKILLSYTGGIILDSLTLIPTQKNHSRGRISNGSPAWGVFMTPTPGTSNSGGYQDYATRPVFSLTPGFYAGTQSLTLSSPDPNVSIHYTTNGDVPTLASTTYTAPITLSATAIVRAAAFSTNPAIAPSFVENNTYLINANHHHLPVVSIASPDYTGLFGSQFGEIMTTLEYFDSLGQPQFEGDGDIRGHGNDSWAFAQKGMRFYTRDDYGYANNIDYRLFEGTTRQEFDVILLKAAGSDNYPGNGLASTHMRDAFAQSLSQKHNLNLDERSWAPCVIYINGQYWGIYEIRERVDADYTEHYYNQDPDSVDMLAYWGGLTVEEGSDTAWNSLYNFMTTNNLSIPANHDYVDQRLDLMSIIDYFILNTYLVNTDWLNWNTAWWRGRSTPGVKWRYRLWDEDNIFNLGQNYTGVGTTTYLNDPCDPTTLFPMDPDIAHTAMITALMADTVFEDLYINRYADLLNTAFDCDTMLNHLQKIVDRLAPEMPQQVARWGGSVAGWNENLDSIRAQITGRCQVVDSLMVGCYNLTGPYDITVLVDPPGFGDVRVNTVIPSNYPYVAGYYGGVTMNLYGVNTVGHPFLNWTILHHSLMPGLSSDSVSMQLASTDTIIAHFDTTFVSNQPLVGTDDYQFRVYPTLVQNRVILEYQFPTGNSAPSLILSDLRGQVVADLSGVFNGQSRGKVEIDLADLRLAKGMYFMRMQAEAWRKTEKLIWVGE